MSKKKKPQRGNLLDIPSEKPTVKKSVKQYGYGNPDEIRRRARQGDHLQQWRERKQLAMLGFDED
jgi:hypothetical protein